MTIVDWNKVAVWFIAHNVLSVGKIFSLNIERVLEVRIAQVDVTRKNKIRKVKLSGELRLYFHPESADCYQLTQGGGSSFMQHKQPFS